jgi:amidase
VEVKVVIDDVLQLDATDQAAAIAARDVTAGELVDAASRRMQECNTELNAVIHLRLDQARVEAQQASSGVFAGVPFLIKDLIAHSAGAPFHEGIAGIKALGFRETTNTTLVDRFRAAGLIDVGRTNTSELGLLPTTEPVSYGPTRNPWDMERSPLGSGGGSAAAVAAGIVAMAHTNDGGGSIRLPASACGLVGLKPSRGRVSLGPDFGDVISGTVAEFAVTRSVRDTAALLDAIATTSFDGEPYAAPYAGRSFREAAYRAAATSDPLKLRVGIMTTSPGDRLPVHPDCATGATVAGKLLEQLGCQVDIAHPAALDEEDWERRAPTIMPFAFAAFGLDWWERRTGHRLTAEDVEPWTWLCAERGRSTTAPRYLAAVEWIQAWSRRVSQWWTDGFDLLVTPTVPEPPPLLGGFGQDDGGRRAGARSAELVAYTYPFNMTGQPAISLPLHWSDAGLPIGVQLVAPLGREDLLLSVAARLEVATPWAQRRAPRAS